MKPIYIYAIERTDSYTLKNSLIDSIRNLNDDKIERFVEMVLGCQPKYTFPAKVYNYDKTCVKVFKSADYLNDQVDYTYEETITKFFITQEEADKYVATGEYTYSRTNNSESEKYLFEARYTYTKESYMSIESWLSSEPVVE